MGKKAERREARVAAAKARDARLAQERDEALATQLAARRMRADLSDALFRLRIIPALDIPEHAHLHKHNFAVLSHAAARAAREAQQETQEPERWVPRVYRRRGNHLVTALAMISALSHGR